MYNTSTLKYEPHVHLQQGGPDTLTADLITFTDYTSGEVKKKKGA